MSDPAARHLPRRLLLARTRPAPSLPGGGHRSALYRHFGRGPARRASRTTRRADITPLVRLGAQTGRHLLLRSLRPQFHYHCHRLLFRWQTAHTSFNSEYLLAYSSTLPPSTFIFNLRVPSSPVPPSPPLSPLDHLLGTGGPLLLSLPLQTQPWQQ